MAREMTDQIRSIAEVLAVMSSPNAVSRILSEHSVDSTGHCRGCRYPTVAAPVWPCRLWEIADETRRNQELRAVK
ncbi:MAG: hypothetical protein QOI36_1474 [Pseudonocardiales bacterium]|jgi:hypothetical protein|nr:hypothetical protein [Pseudonocardia sp.]MDT7650068.1 hypothetical protein [Pseudonocardiales bacterium]